MMWSREVTRLNCVDIILVRQGQTAVILGIQIETALESYQI